MYFTSRKISSPFLWQSIAISYILKAMCSILHTKIFVNIIFSWSGRVLIITAIAIALSVTAVFLSESQKVKNLLCRINHKTTHDDIWLDVIDYTGTTVRCVCNDGSIYSGTLTFHEEKGIDSWFILESYIVEESDGSYESEGIDYPSKLAVNLKNVKRVELYYSKGGNRKND